MDSLYLNDFEADKRTDKKLILSLQGCLYNVSKRRDLF